MRYNINLLGEKKRGFFEGLFYFFLNYLRYILVITQLVVIGVLMYRFMIDQTIIDLKDSIDQKKAIVKAVEPLISEAQKINYQVTQAQGIIQNQQAFAHQINYILSQFPQAATLTTFSIDSSKIDLNGVSTNPKDIQLFYSKLKADNRYSSVLLSNLKKDIGGYSFAIELSGFKDQEL